MKGINVRAAGKLGNRAAEAWGWNHWDLGSMLIHLGTSSSYLIEIFWRLDSPFIKSQHWTNISGYSHDIQKSPVARPPLWWSEQIMVKFFHYLGVLTTKWLYCLFLSRAQAVTSDKRNDYCISSEKSPGSWKKASSSTHLQRRKLRKPHTWRTGKVKCPFLVSCHPERSCQLFT